MSQEENLSCTEWKPTAVLDPDYQDYAIVIMDTPLEWSREHMFAVWEKSKLTVTVNEGTVIWFTNLSSWGIDVRDESNKKYVPNIIIINIGYGALHNQLQTIIDLFASLGSTVLFMPNQGVVDSYRVLKEVADYANDMHINLKEIYVFALQIANNEFFGNDTTILYRTNGEVNNIRIIIVKNLYFLWILHPGVHKIHVPKKQMLLQALCGVIPHPAFCIDPSCSTDGLEYNLTNASVADILASPLDTTYIKEIVTVKTRQSITWLMKLDISKEIVPKEPNNSSNVDR